MRLIYLTLISMVPLACSSLFWRSASLPPETIHSGQSTLTYQTVYLERDSWNPLMGTTVKKSYQTRLTLYPKGEGSTAKELPNLTSWTLPGLIAYNSGTDRLFWIQGTDDEYGTYSRKAGRAEKIQEKGFSQAEFWNEEKGLLDLSVSPDGNYYAIVHQTLNTDQIPSYFLSIWKWGDPKPSERISLSNWEETTGVENSVYSLSWQNSKTLRIKMDSSTINWVAKQ